LRHVNDLVRGQAAAGLEAGIICDSGEKSPRTQMILKELEPLCPLGIHRFPMQRNPGPGDFAAVRKVRALAAKTKAGILHGHGAKGGAYARLAAGKGRSIALYTPHGGSLHYSAGSLKGKIFFAMERYLEGRTAAILFESRYGLDTYKTKIGAPRCPVRVIHNGLSEADFTPVLPGDNVADFLYLGELRLLKGVDLFLRALAGLAGEPRALIVGSGPEEEHFRSMAAGLGLKDRTEFRAPVPIREAFGQARIMVMPSRAESFPYVVLESVAARMPLITTRVGGIPEIFAGHEDRLVPPDDAASLEKAMAAALADPEPLRRQSAALADYAREHFSVGRMVSDINAAYAELTGAA
jgi:glycosyltransferase involved in cell wall biosynthesis